VNSVNVTVRFGEEELRKLDELAQRMGVTRSDVIRDLINRFEDVLRQEVEKERKRWVTMGVVGALESIILGPGLILRFIRRNVDILEYPDFVVGMVRVRNRVVVFSHHDELGHKLLQLVRSKIEDEVRREEAEIEREEDEDEEGGGVKATQVRATVHTGVRPRIPRAGPVPSKYKLLISNKVTSPVAKPTAVAAAGRSGGSSGSGDAKAATTASVPENKKLVATGIPATNNSAAPQVEGSNPQASVKGGATGSSGPVEQTPVGKPAGDFVLALIAHSYHKYRGELLRLVESIVGG
jgi:Arc/MetJ-type ribon-helix-helix transcriptional regulator